MVTVHLMASYWILDVDRRLAMLNTDGPLRAYAAVHAVTGEPFRIEWPLGRFGQRRTTHGGPVLWINPDETLTLFIDRRLAQQAQRPP